MTANTANAEPLSFKEKLGYGLGDGASNFSFKSSTSSCFTTTPMCLGSPRSRWNHVFSNKIVDTVTDPMMGIIGDRTETKMGQVSAVPTVDGHPIRTMWLPNVRESRIV